MAENVIGNRPDAVLFQMSASEKKNKHFQITKEEQKRRKICIKDQRTSQRLSAAYKKKKSKEKNLIELELLRCIWHFLYTPLRYMHML